MEVIELQRPDTNMANGQSRFHQNLRNSMVYASWFAAICGVVAGLNAAGAQVSTIALYLVAVGPIALVVLLLICRPLKERLDKQNARVAVLVGAGLIFIGISFLFRLG